MLIYNMEDAGFNLFLLHSQFRAEIEKQKLPF